MRKIGLLIGLFFIAGIQCAFADVWSYLNYLQDVRTQINTLLIAQRELTSIQNQAQNLGKVSNYQWQNVSQLLNQMDESMQAGQAISYQLSGADTDFRERYPNYTEQSVGQVNYAQAYHTWDKTTLDTLRNSVSATSIDASNLHSEADVIAQLKQQGSSATGRLQALQVSTEIAGENVDQLMQLRRLMMAQMTAENAYMAYQVSQDSYSELELNALVAKANADFPRYHDNDQLGKIHTVQ